MYRYVVVNPKARREKGKELNYTLETQQPFICPKWLTECIFPNVCPSFFSIPLPPSKPALPLVYVVETCLMWCYIVEIWDVSNGLEFFSYLVCVFNEILPFLIQFDLGRHTHTHTNLIYATKQEIAGKRQAELSRQLPTRLSKFQLYLWTFVYRIRWSQLGCCLGGNLAYKYKVSQDVLW